MREPKFCCFRFLSPFLFDVGSLTPTGYSPSGPPYPHPLLLSTPLSFRRTHKVVKLQTGGSKSRIETEIDRYYDDTWFNTGGRSLSIQLWDRGLYLT